MLNNANTTSTYKHLFSINDPNKRIKKYGSLVPNARPLHDTPSSFSAQQGMGIDTAPLSLDRPTNGRAKTFFFIKGVPRRVPM